MEGAGVKTMACALVVIVVASRVAGEYESRGSDMVEGPRVERMHPETSDGCSGSGSNCLQNSEGPVGAMWFGPRLGRRRRSDAKLAGKKIEALGEMLAQPNWSIDAISDANVRTSSSGSSSNNDEKRQETTFTPRLGRELEDSLSFYELLRALLSRVDEPNNSDKEREQQPQRVLPPPRLGRNLLLTPRLERELSNLLRKLQMK